VWPQPGEQRQLVAAHQHVHRVDLEQADPVEHPTQVAPVDAPGRAWVGEALGGEGDPLRLRVGEGDRHATAPSMTEIVTECCVPAIEGVASAD
jgi:hypothetical protein